MNDAARYSPAETLRGLGVPGALGSSRALGGDDCSHWPRRVTPPLFRRIRCVALLALGLAGSMGRLAAAEPAAAERPAATDSALAASRVSATRGADVQPSVLVSGGAMMNGNQFADATLAAMRTHYAGCRHVVLVLHASHPRDRDAMEARLQKAFAHLGVPMAESLHRRDDAGARALLEKADGIFVGGGETFVLLRELTRTGQLALLRERVRAGVPYGGASAGANIAGLIIGTTNDFPVADIPSRAALGLLPATINPHHPAATDKAEFDARAAKIRGYLRFNPDETVLALGNAGLVRLDHGRARVVAGRAWIYRTGTVRELAEGDDVPELAPKP